MIVLTVMEIGEEISPYMSVGSVAAYLLRSLGNMLKFAIRLWLKYDPYAALFCCISLPNRPPAKKPPVAITAITGLARLSKRLPMRQLPNRTGRIFSLHRQLLDQIRHLTADTRENSGVVSQSEVRCPVHGPDHPRVNR